MAGELMGSAAPPTSHEIALLAQAGDQLAQRVFSYVGHALAIGLTSLINTLNLPLYVIGGGVCEAWDLFSPTMFHELTARSYVYRLTQPTIPQSAQFERHKTYILGAQLGPTAGLLGACLLALQPESHRPALQENVFVHQ
jgi:glucokinase